MFEFGDVVVMRSQHRAASGARLQIARAWVNRGGAWMSTLSYQTVMPAAAPAAGLTSAASAHESTLIPQRRYRDQQ